MDSSPMWKAVLMFPKKGSCCVGKQGEMAGGKVSDLKMWFKYLILRFLD